MRVISTSEVIDINDACVGIVSNDPLFTEGVKGLLKLCRSDIAPGTCPVMQSKILFLDLDSLDQSIFEIVRTLTHLSYEQTYRVVFWTTNQHDYTLNFLRTIENASFISKNAQLEPIKKAMQAVLRGEIFISPAIDGMFRESNKPGNISEETFTILDNMMSGVRVKRIAANLQVADKSIYSKMRQFRGRLALMRKSDFLSFIHEIS
ncbi:response regulator transcription factor [Enterobacillus tribolii]|uniref:DNA-binding NarL/FixJ family response regulator n=1 Tax=Enterobacillus tribolii TaxID=1487935 RepID=A0A370QU67_9GAMM|nr:response regulator transcription factor [Enterobacillus tribolii]MBW7981148.1 response regulator transcription factor [Enterobacillus tribolii]RDK92794.1 DNA-binding NarL/FixJ family response regulator [Enterobacillus tribolii]